MSRLNGVRLVVAEGQEFLVYCARGSYVLGCGTLPVLKQDGIDFSCDI